MASSFRRISKLLPFPSKISQQKMMSTMINRSLLTLRRKPHFQQRAFSAQAAVKQTKMQSFSIYRWDPASSAPPQEQTYEVDVSDCPMILDVLIKIKNQHDSVESLLLLPPPPLHGIYRLNHLVWRRMRNFSMVPMVPNGVNLLFISRKIAYALLLIPIPIDCACFDVMTPSTDIVLSEVVPRGNLRIVLDEH